MYLSTKYTDTSCLTKSILCSLKASTEQCYHVTDYSSNCLYSSCTNFFSIRVLIALFGYKPELGIVLTFKKADVLLKQMK